MAEAAFDFSVTTPTIIDLMDEVDWALTPIGPPDRWSQSLRASLSICLKSRFPMIIFWGPELVQLYNDAYTPILGDKHPRALGQRASECWPEIWSSIGPMLNGVLRDGDATWAENLLLPLRRHGRVEECYFTFSYSPVEESGNVGGVFCAVTETTSAVLRERETLERVEALAQLDRAKTTFFNNVSHEFRTPLTLMLGPAAELAARTSGEEQRLSLTIRRNALRLLKLVNTLLEFSRLEAGKSEASFLATELSAATRDLCAIFHSAFERAGLRFGFSSTLHERAYVDPAMWEKIVLNLLSNALKYTTAGEVAVELGRVDNAAELRVRDSGIGIPPEHLDRLFERFHRVPGTLARSYEGSGIGLALVDELTRAHGGSVRVESTPGLGSTFIVTIPLGREHLDPAHIQESATAYASVVEQYLADVEATMGGDRETLGLETRPTGEARVLVADDNRDLREYLARILGARYDVVTARNGREALQRLEEDAFDLVVSDVMMPELDGFELIARIRSDPRLAPLPVILLSARADEESTVAGLAHGADDYLSKPFSAEELQARVAAHLAAVSLRARARDEAAARREFLSEASRILGRSLELEPTLKAIAHVVVPGYADWCQIDLEASGGQMRTAAIVHQDPYLDALAQRFVGTVHLSPDADDGNPLVLQTGRTVSIPDVDAIVEKTVGDAAEVALYRRLGLGTALCVPLTAEGRCLGAIAFMYTDRSRRHSAEDSEMLEELGRRAGLAVLNATRFEREHRVAASFQNAALPGALPEVPGLRLDAVYAAADDQARLGGDWYDAVRLYDGRVVLSIGDVTGSGLPAAVTMATMRQIIRGTAQLNPDPALMLDAADRALMLEQPDMIVTAFVAVLDPVTFTLHYASAGHPPAFLRRPDGTVESLSDGGLPLGLRRFGSRARGGAVQILPGSRMLLYTDGLTEARHLPASDQERLMRAVAAGDAFLERRPAAAFLKTMLNAASARDDIAVLVIELNADVAHRFQRWQLDCRDEAAARSTRVELIERMRAVGASPEAVSSAELVLGELLGNAARYAPGPVEVIFEGDGNAVLHVLDEGPGFVHAPPMPEPELFVERGRGLYIVSMLSEDFRVSRRADRGSHARVVLSRER